MAGAHFAVSTAAQGKRWQRVRVVEEPLTEYTQYEMASYIESQAAGEEIRIARRSRQAWALRRDFWLFDYGTPQVRALLLNYTPEGEWRGAEWVTDAGGLLAALAAERDLALACSVPLNEYFGPDRTASGMNPAQARPHWARLGRELRRLREFAGLTQRDMATTLKVSQTTIDRIESGGPHGSPRRGRRSGSGRSARRQRRPGH